jgi:DNA-binding transcriptional LysR family regulator
MAREGRTSRVAVETGGWEAVKLYVAEGVGVGLVPEIVVGESDRRRLRVTAAGHLFGSESYGILSLAERPPTRAAETMRQILQATVRR